MSRLLFFPFLATCLAVANLNAQSTPLTASATPASITFGYVLGAATLPAAQKVAVKASSGTPSYLAVVTDAAALWLTVAPATGNLPGSLSLRANPTGLGVGQYVTSITVTVVGVATPVSVPVTLNVTAPPSTLAVNPTSLAFSAPPSPVTAQTVVLSTSGAPISFTVTSAAPWLSVVPNVGVVLPGEQEMLTITADPTTLAPATKPYSSKVTITVLGVVPAPKAQIIVVNLTVNASTPTISGIWPATLPLNAGAQTITIRGTKFYSATVASIQSATTALPTTYVSDTVLMAVVPAAQLIAAGTLNILVSNPAPGGSSAPFPLPVASIPTIISIVNVASYGAAAVSPGELITIFGTNLGPAAPAAMTITNGSADTTLGGVTLTIDTISAPLLYVSQNQVTAQVPYEVKIGPGIQVSLTNGANPPATSTVTVALMAPGVFTADGSGLSQAAALNYVTATKAYTLNTASNPAHLGDTILLYLTGEGDYNTSVTPRTGLIVPASWSPLPQLSPLPTVTIGGAAATVAYAGPLVGSILGLMQINCVVPAASTTGTAVPVVVTIGSGNTQANVTLSIHP